MSLERAEQNPNELKMFLFLSELLGKRVRTFRGEPAGALKDLKLRMGELFPMVVAIVLKRRGQKGPLELDWSEVSGLTSEGACLKDGAEARMRPVVVGENEILLREELLDKQVVDTQGAKIERVNDIHLLFVHGELRIVHVDFGPRGILRRLGWLRAADGIMNWLFSYKIAERLISWKYIQPLEADPAKKNLKLNVTLRRLQEIHPSDLADILEELDQQNRSRVFKALDIKTAAQTLEEAEPKLQLALIGSAPVEKATDILEEMAPDDATDLLADLPEEDQQRFFQKMERPHVAQIAQLIQFEEGTAGSIMTKDFLALRQDQTIGDAQAEFQKSTHPLETLAYIFVTDEARHPLGVLTLRHLLLCDKARGLAQLMNPRLIKVTTEDKVSKVAEIFQKYKFIALPVVDQDDVLQGIITLQDIVESELGE